MLILAAKKKTDNNIEKFTKEQFLQSKRYIQDRDILNVLLDDDKKYSFTEVDELLNKFLETEV